MQLHVLAIAVFAVSVHVCEIIMYEHANVLDSNLTLKMKFKDVEDLNGNWLANILILCQHVYIFAKLGALCPAVCPRYIS